MGVKKNKFLEEWNGLREITDLSYQIEGGRLPRIIILALVIPFGVFHWVRAEFVSKGDHRYKDMV